MKRFEAYKIIAAELKEELVVTGSFSPAQWEFYSIGDRDRNFYIYHSMGMVSSTALGLALALPDMKIVAIDGDGAFLMNLNSVATVAKICPKNLVWIVVDNECHETTGGQPTATSGKTSLEKIAKGAGIENAVTVRNGGKLRKVLTEALDGHDLCYIVVKVEKGSLKVPECPLRPDEIKGRFLKCLCNSASKKVS